MQHREKGIKEMDANGKDINKTSIKRIYVQRTAIDEVGIKETHAKKIAINEMCTKEEQINKESTKYQFLLQGITIVSLLLCVVAAVYAYKLGILTSVDSLQQFIARFGIGGLFIFTAIQAVQVVIPILPGGIGCLGGVILFGAWKGFACNYIGICIGSILAFAITKCWGRPIMHKLFSEKTIQKYEQWAQEDKHFAKLFAAAIFLPVAPDDFLCYLAGTTNMGWKQFVLIILLGKPFAIAMYSLGLTVVFQNVMSMIF